MTPKQNQIIHRAIQTFGARNQVMQSIEETMELQHALFENIHRGTDNQANIVEEVADVEIMLAQIKKIYGIGQNEIEAIKDKKLERLEHTISKYKAKQLMEKEKEIKPLPIQIDRITSNGK